MIEDNLTAVICYSKGDFLTWARIRNIIHYKDDLFKDKFMEIYIPIYEESKLYGRYIDLIEFTREELKHSSLHKIALQRIRS